MASPPKKKNTPKATPAKKRSKLIRLLRWSALCSLVLALYISWQMWEVNRFGHSDNGQKADCAIVLGAAAWHNKPSPVFRARIDHAIKLYHENRIAKIILTGGKGKGAAFAESEVARDYCIKTGKINPAHLFIETLSDTTDENFAEAKKIMREQKLANALIVSDPWHLKRAQLLAENHDITATPSATLTSQYKSTGAKLKFLIREVYYLHIYRLVGSITK